jgi:hypothetical protein
MGKNTSQYAKQGIEHQSSVVILCKIELQQSILWTGPRDYLHFVWGEVTIAGFDICL